MKKPEQTPLDPNAPRSKQVKQIPMPKLFSDYIKDDLEQVNELLDEISNEDSQNSN